jgi:hypothetical protein
MNKEFEGWTDSKQDGLKLGIWRHSGGWTESQEDDLTS